MSTVVEVTWTIKPSITVADARQVAVELIDEHDDASSPLVVEVIAAGGRSASFRISSDDEQRVESAIEWLREEEPGSTITRAAAAMTH